MNIQELAKQAIARIDTMSTEELRAKFIEHGYTPEPLDWEQAPKTPDSQN